VETLPPPVFGKEDYSCNRCSGVCNLPVADAFLCPFSAGILRRGRV
jgi:hypothetical protein